MSTKPSLLRQIVDRVVVEPVRSGSLRVRDWTPQLITIGIVAALSALASVVLIALGGWLRATQPLTEHADVSMPLVAFGPVVIIACIALTFLLAGMAQASWPIRIASVFLAIGAFGSVMFTAWGWRDYLRSAPVAAALVGFTVVALWRSKGTTWWLPSAVLVIVTTGFVMPLAFARDHEIELIVLGLFTTVLAAAAAARTLLWAVAGVIGVGFFFSIAVGIVNNGIAVWTFGTPNPIVGKVSTYSTLIMRGLGALVALGFALRAWRQRQRRVFVVAIVLSVVLGIAAGTGNGWWSRWWNQAGVAVAMIGVTIIFIAIWVIGRRFTHHRAAQALAMVGLSLAVALPDLIGDPVAALLGATGAGAIFFGLIWNMLTSADFANDDTPRFPRQARVLLLFGLALITLLQFALSSIVQAGALANVGTSSMNIGTNEVGTALLIAAWALLGFDSLFPARSVAGVPTVPESGETLVVAEIAAPTAVDVAHSEQLAAGGAFIEEPLAPGTGDDLDE